MTNEEKARAYDEAVKIARCWLNDPQTIQDCNYTIEDAIQNIFPQLRESEDERIRRALVEYFGPKVQLDFVRGVPIQKIRDWLEKQKEPTKEELYAEAGTTENEYIANTMKMVRAMREKQKEQKPAWKPSEEQIRSLEYFIELWGDSDGQLKYAKIFNDVKSLCEQLKSL